MNKFLVFFFLFADTIYAWSWPSHVIIYMIARKEIGQEKSALIDKVIAQIPEKEANYPNPYEIAIWPDEIKGRDKVDLFNGFHFYDQQFCDGIDPKKVKAILDPVYNVVNAVIIGQNTIKYRPPFPYHFDGHFEKSLGLRFLIHMVGDMHQPLHVATRCTPAHPECDAGGNNFPINGGQITKNLHALWDQAMQKIPFEKRPLNQNTINKYQGIADTIVKQFPRSSLQKELSMTNQFEIAKMTFEIAVNSAYKGIKENEKPSDEYLRTRFEICKRQIALAGYRLADMLKQINYSFEEE